MAAGGTFAERLWLYAFPLLFLPRIGLPTETRFGVIAVSDYFIGPFLVFLLLGNARFRRLPRGVANPLFMIALIVLISVATLPLRYDYEAGYEVVFSLIKAGKFEIYALAGVLSAKALAVDRVRARFLWSVLVAGVTVAVSFMVEAATTEDISLLRNPEQHYSAPNAISVYLSMIICFILALLISREGGWRWRRWGLACLAVMTIGLLLTGGRGGWLAGLAGVSFIFWHKGLSRRATSIALLAVLLLGGAYVYLPTFAEQVDRTVWPDMAELERYGAGVGGIDDGQRVSIWITSAGHIVEEPLLGTGFFHRGGESGLPVSGSHNFFLQMFLEVGVVGGGLVLLLIYRMWAQATSASRVAPHMALAVRSVIVVAIIGGMGGEYFYGGMGLVLLFSLWGCCLRAPGRAGKKPSSAGRTPRSGFAMKAAL